MKRSIWLGCIILLDETLHCEEHHMALEKIDPTMLDAEHTVVVATHAHSS